MGSWGPGLFLINNGHEQAEAEMSTVAQSQRAANWFWEVDNESVARTAAPIAAAVVSDGLELQRAETLAAKLKRAFALVQLPDGGGGTLWMQSQQPK